MVTKTWERVFKYIPKLHTNSRFLYVCVQITRRQTDMTETALERLAWGMGWGGVWLRRCVLFTVCLVKCLGLQQDYVSKNQKLHSRKTPQGSTLKPMQFFL